MELGSKVKTEEKHGLVFHVYEIKNRKTYYVQITDIFDYTIAEIFWEYKYVMMFKRGKLIDAKQLFHIERYLSELNKKRRIE